MVPTLMTRGSAYSVSAWVRLARVGDAIQTLVARDGRAGDSAFYLQYDGNLHAFAFGLPQARALAVNAPPTVAGNWYHVVGVQDPRRGDLRVYVNGLLAGAVEARGHAPAPKGPLTVGRSEAHGRPVDFLGGAIDVAQVFPYALTGEQVATMFNAGSGGN